MQIQVQIHQVGVATAEGVARTHHVLIDRPTEKGGEDRGMMGGEYLLVALGGCFMSNLLAAIRAREAEIHDVRLEVTGTLASAPSRFTEIEVVVGARCADPALLEKLVEMADRACICTNTLRPAVIPTFRISAIER
ncbi:OsmC family protein [Deinococcus peraridilitoris]|uniref:Putative redox protein, regulator of disulfide bond formation n=1 Tax=Deinococcus peraridilitoris (strain DSM 19664 / LMG 22246 / CIP 109416 / KR-200) TaxID=937777 RepID=K9ZXD6_DEIPD|nr:OsmC family protein [Deinococcus peraridilitoris]AFZ66236.1 putative redox protein, regulator of disulfide bond formation [Deinococcus peraridilitoris DSM 19664]